MKNQTALKLNYGNAKWNDGMDEMKRNQIKKKSFDIIYRNKSNNRVINK